MLTLYELDGRELSEPTDDQIAETLWAVSATLASVNALYGKATGLVDARSAICDELERWQASLREAQRGR